MDNFSTLRGYIQRHRTARARIVADDWKDAVRKAVALLEQAGAVESRYFDSIIDVTTQHGPYYVIAPGIAMPHARPEDGVLETGFSLVTLASPVEFGNEENDPVDVVLCLSAKSKGDLNEHVIVEAMTLFESEPMMARLRASGTDTELMKVLDGIGWAGERE
jgi:ascorbate PTS system EIIA or EIIAB component